MSYPDSQYGFAKFLPDGSTLTGWAIHDTGTLYVNQMAVDDFGVPTQITYEYPYGVDLADWYYSQGVDGSAVEDGAFAYTSFTPANPYSTGFTNDPNANGWIHDFGTNLAESWL